jgi:hypothetical protein
MKTKILLSIIALTVCIFSSCEDKSYLLGLPEYDHHYYIAFVPANNTKVTVDKSQTTLLKFPVQFYSSFVRNYDAIALYKVVPAATNPAILGQDFNIVDKDGNEILPVNGEYSILLPQAKKVRDTIYVKLLNNPDVGTRSAEIQLVENVTELYRVDTMSTAFRRPLEIK